MALPDLSISTIDGQLLKVQDLQGQLVLWVNTASACGFTPQLSGLQALQEQYGQRGLVVIGSPCNQFGAQDPESAERIQAYCQKNHGVTFTLTEKIEVNGKNTHPVFEWLKTQAPGLLGSKSIKWNFTKFLIDRDGRVVKRYAPTDTPQAIGKDVEALL